MVKKIILWILVISCMGTIFFLSSQEATESSNLSKGFISQIVEFFDVRNTLSESEIAEISITLNNIVRTGAHFTIYAILGFLVAFLLSEYKYYGKKQIVYSVLCSFLYACTDELHQHFVPGRSAQLIDLIVDTVGALFGTIIAIIIVKIIRKNITR